MAWFPFRRSPDDDTIMMSSSSRAPALGGFLCHSTCLKPSYSLRRQLLISFGVTGMITTSLVVLMACLCVLSTGRVVQEEAREFMREEVLHSITTSSQYAADSFSQELDHLRGTVSLIVEIVRDRIVGYPLEFQDDQWVPFKNTDGQNRYPLKSKLLPRDWNVTPNINATNYEEHVQELFDLLHHQGSSLSGHSFADAADHHDNFLTRFSTESAAYVFQGNCDPSVNDKPWHAAYYPGCSDAHNNGTTGGVVRPTSLSAALEAKAADIGTLLKPIWESRPDLVVVTVHFVNDGAGSMVQFPAFIHDSHPRAYKSIGCDWLYNTTNPHTGRPFLSRNNSTTQPDCHPAGTWVPQREFNAMETEFCRDQALHGNETRFHGPLVDGFFTGALHDGSVFWVMRVGRAIFDRRSGEFIGCVALEVLLNRWTELIIDTLDVQNYSSAVLVRGHDGAVVAGGEWSLYESAEGTHITEMTDVIGSPEFYDQLREEVDRKRHDHDLEHPDEHAQVITAVVECSSGRTLSASSLPGSDFIYVQAVGEEVFDVIEQLKYDIDQDVLYSTLVALLIGGIGMTVLLVIVWLESMILTRPLNWIQQIAWSIVNHTDSSVIKQSLRADEPQGSGGMSPQDSSDEIDMTLHPIPEDDTSVGTMTASLLKWTPNTEITELVKEFKQMIRGFSGAENASTVARPNSHEIRNTLVWQGDFQQLYNKSKGADCGEKQNDAMKPDNLIDGTLKHSLRSLEIPCGEEDCDGPETEESQESEDPAADDATSKPDDNGDIDSKVGDTSRISPGTTKESYRCQKQPPMTKDGQASPGVSRISEGSSSASECLFRSSKRTNDDNSGVSLAQPSLIQVQSATTATTTTFIPQLLVLPENGWKNEGRNVIPSNQPKTHRHERDSDSACIPYQSPLYRWILVLFAIPMIITNAVIAVVVSNKIGDVLPKWLEDIDGASFRIQLEELSVTSRFASIYARSVLATPVRDLFVYTRVAGWVFTDAVELDPNGFVEMGTGSEECKAYPNDGHSCPWYSDMFNNAPCDCGWEAPPAPGCFQFDEAATRDVRDTRWMQKLFYSGQRHDADPLTGRRTASSFPMVDFTAANTSWWNDIERVPGSREGNNDTRSSYHTTYDRLRAFSALSTMIFPLYNYRTSLVDSDHHQYLGAYFGFQSDGMITGWGGCKHPSPKYPHFQSKESNQAFKIAPELCPELSFGYDVRCRGWFESGKQIAQEAVNATSLFITPPYEFASMEEKASSATQAIVDPRTGEFIGQTLVDFLQFELINFGHYHDDKQHKSFSFVITPSEDALGSDTVYASSGRSNESMTAAIGDIMLPFDDANSSNRHRFDDIVSDMKDGNSCLQNFTRTGAIHQEDGYTVFGPETFWLAYDPVLVRALDTIRCDDYSRGLKTFESLVYSLGVGRTEKSLQSHFEEFEKQAEEPLMKNIGVYVGLTILISLLAASVSCRLSASIARPMIILLNVVKQINAGKIEDDIAPLFGGSRETNQVYTSFAKLYKIVRVSNGAFFSRNLHWACHFVRDALNLFSKIEDRKAIAIASGNLGSTLLAINCSRPRENRISCLFVECESVCCVQEACVHFETAVRSGTEDFQTAADMIRKVEFAEQLSDRLFNRGLYYLLSMDDPCAGQDFEARGLEDLMKVQALDLDVLEYWIENGMLKEKSSILFDRLLRRVHGLCALMENGVSQTLWDPKSLAYDCHRLLSAAWDNPTHSLFEEASQIGRLQQLEGALINLQLQKNLEADAARIAMRMLVEDEYLDERSFQYAADALLRFTLQSEISWSPLSKASAQRDIKAMLKTRKLSGVHSQKCIYLCMELSDSRHLSSPALRRQLLSLYDSHCGMDDYFGLLACGDRSLLLGSSSNNHPMNQNQNSNNFIQLDLECKKARQGEQRQGIESALDALAEMDSPSLSASTNLKPLSSTSSLDLRLPMLLTTPAPTCRALTRVLKQIMKMEDDCSAYDSYIIYVTDGPKRAWDSKVMAALKSQIEDMNAKRKGDIHLILLDLEEPPDDHHKMNSETATAINHCRSLCRVSQGSAYIPSSIQEYDESDGNNNPVLEESFAAIRSCLSNGSRSGGSASCSNALLSGITMEKF